MPTETEELRELDMLGLKWDSREEDKIVLGVQAGESEHRYAISPEQLHELSESAEMLQLLREGGGNGFASGSLQDEV